MRVTSRVPERRHGHLLAAAMLLVAVACGGTADPAAIIGQEAESSGAPKVAADMVAGIAPMASRMAVAPAPPPSPRATTGGAITTMLIRRGDVQVRVDSLEPAMAALHRLATSLGGTVGNVSVAAGEQQRRSATLELRIPAPRFDEAMGGLTPIGRVEQSAVTAEDVSEEYVDLGARVANAKRLEQRLVELLATRAGKLEDVLAVERELARVREEIERHEGRLRWLGARVATSTISVTVLEPAPVLGEAPGHNVIGEAFVQAWRNFVGLVAAAIASLGVLVPAGVLLFAAVRWWRGRRRPAA